jgi:hypothetical protein
VLADEKYILLTTFRRDNSPVSTPVWTVPLDDGDIGLGKYGFMTKITRLLNAIGGSLKGKRIPYADRGVVISLKN